MVLVTTPCLLTITKPICCTIGIVGRFNDGSAFRQTCLSELTFNDPENEINNIVPHHAQLFPDLNKDDRQFIKVDEILSSSERNKDFMAKMYWMAAMLHVGKQQMAKKIPIYQPF